jgi:predicted MFS family arabinose efflux permease
MVYPTLLAAIADVAHASWRASAVGVYRLWRDLGYAIGALLAGLTADAFGLSTALWLTALLTFASGVLVARHMTETHITGGGTARRPSATNTHTAASLLMAATLLCIGYRVISPEALAAQAARGLGDLWTAAQTIEPAALVKEWKTSSPTDQPLVVCVGYRALYRAGHVPNASFHGPTSTPEGLESLKRWAQGQERGANIVLYCGCCPLKDCPNIRPAFSALRDMGFKRVRVLMLPNSFGVDWADKGFPVER